MLVGVELDVVVLSLPGQGHHTGWRGRRVIPRVDRSSERTYTWPIDRKESTTTWASMGPNQVSQ